MDRCGLCEPMPSLGRQGHSERLYHRERHVQLVSLGTLLRTGGEEREEPGSCGSSAMFAMGNGKGLK